MNEKAEKKFTASWMNSNQKLHQIYEFKRTYHQFEKEIELKYHQEADHFIKEIESGNDYDSLFIDKKGFFDKSGGRSVMTRIMANRNVVNAKNLLDASILVFVHSLFDGFLFDMIEVVKEISPKSFSDRYKNKKVNFLDVEKDKDTLILEFIEKERLDRKSLKEKIEILFILCKPPEVFKPMRDYEFDIEEMIKMDDFRNKVVHKDISLDGDWVFDYFKLSQTLTFFMCLMNQGFGLKINPFLWKEHLKEESVNGGV